VQGSCKARGGTQLVSPRLLPSCDAQCFFESDLASSSRLRPKSAMPSKR
jgi:hypothetical protein